MELIASTHAKDLRRMTVSASGTGERNLFVSYISEVPGLEIHVPDPSTGICDRQNTLTRLGDRG